MGLSDWLNKAKQSPAFRPAYIKIKSENIDDQEFGKNTFESNKQYFEVVINEMYLSYRREWLTTFDPMVFVTTEFEYAGKKSALPTIVGPSMILDKKQKLPEGQGFMFKNTTVAGIHPVKGNSISITIILARMPRNNPLKKTLGVLENISKTYLNEFNAIASGYLKIANVVLNGIDMITDSQDVKAIVGIRDEYSHNNMKPGYYVLINEESEQFNRDNFFVKEKELHYGENMLSSKPFRSDDYVLYSLNAVLNRMDIETLTIFDRWKKINESVSKIMRKLSEDEKKLYRGQLLELGIDMTFSPDITKPQVDLLKKQYKSELEEIINEREGLSGEKLQEKAVTDNWKNEIELLRKELYQ